MRLINIMTPFVSNDKTWHDFKLESLSDCLLLCTISICIAAKNMAEIDSSLPVLKLNVSEIIIFTSVVKPRRLPVFHSM